MNLKRIGIFYIIFIFLGIGAVARIISLQYFNVPKEKEEVAKTSMESTLESKRGSIMATDGRFMAFSQTEYRIFLDCTQAVDTVFDKNIDELSRKLAETVGDHSAKGYRELIEKGRLNGRHYLCLTRNYLSYQEMKTISEFPILKLGRFKGGRLVEPHNVRRYPYGTLAYRVLGQLHDSTKIVGIEASCDSILRGKDGRLTIKRTEHNRWIEDMDSLRINPVDGMDVRTTIDIDIQEIAEKALRHQLAKSDDIKYGTVVVMETSTGRIRAMVNLNKGKDGKYHENYNYAIAGAGEPGSVFKLATLTLMLDEGKTTLNHVMNPAPKVLHCGKAKPMTDDYLDKYKEISVLRGFEISSNNVFRKLAWDNYASHPTEFVDLLNNKLMIGKDFDFDIEGLSRPYIKHPSEKDGKGRRTWADSDLPQIAMGYTSRLAPLHTVNFYNAIANGGLMVRPKLIESIEKDGKVVKSFEVEEMGRVCSEKTARELHRALRSVVLEGTGKGVFEGCKVEVAGKTGTARVNYGKAGNLKQHQATFAGFFPYEDPKYTVIAVIYSNPSKKNFYGATWGGPVVREIAEEMYGCNPQWAEPICSRAKLPKENKTISLRDAVASYEKSGYKVTIKGSGHVVAQDTDSLGENVTLILE